MPITVPNDAEINATAGYFFSSANPLNRPLVIFVSGGSVSFPFIKLRAWLRAKIPTITTIKLKPEAKYSISKVYLATPLEVCLPTIEIRKPNAKSIAAIAIFCL